MATSLKPDPKNPIPIKSRRGGGGKGKGPDDALSRTDKKLKQAEMLLSVSRKVAAIESLDEILTTLVEMTTWELSAARCSSTVVVPTRSDSHRF